MNEFLPMVAVGEPNGVPDLQNRLKQYPEIDCLELKHLRRSLSPIHDFLAILELRRLYKKIKPDIVHLNSTKAGILGSFANTMVPLIYTVHGWVFHEPLSPIRRALYRALERATAKHKTNIIVLSEREEKSGRALGIPPHKLTIIPPGIETPHLMSRHDARALLRARAQSDIPMDAAWLGTIANCFPTKGIDVFIRAFAREKDATRYAHAVIIGDGPERKKLEALRDAMGLNGRMHFVGFLPNAARLLSAFDVFVLPSRKEGVPYTLIEAKLHGIPIIATDVGGVSDLIIQNQTGRIVPPEHPEGLGLAIRETLANLSQAKNMAVAGRTDATAARFAKARMVADTTALYWSLLRREE